MRSSKQIILLAVVCASTSSVMADDWKWGLAGTIGDQHAIRVPVTNGNVVIEPFMSRSQYKESNSYSESESESHSIGVGLWKICDIEDQFTLRAGVAASLFKESGHHKLMSNDAFVDTDRDSDGYTISPGIGLFYRVKDNISVGLETTYNFSKAMVFLNHTLLRSQYCVMCLAGLNVTTKQHFIVHY